MYQVLVCAAELRPRDMRVTYVVWRGERVDGRIVESSSVPEPNPRLRNLSLVRRNCWLAL